MAYVATLCVLHTTRHSIRNKNTHSCMEIHGYLCIFGLLANNEYSLSKQLMRGVKQTCISKIDNYICS